MLQRVFKMAIVQGNRAADWISAKVEANASGDAGGGPCGKTIGELKLNVG